MGDSEGTAANQTAVRDQWMNQGLNLSLNRSVSPGATSGSPPPATASTAFDDDPLSADGFGPNDVTIRVKPGPVRTTLMRPKPDTPKDYQRGYRDGASGGVGSCRVDATADEEEESAYEQGYADGKAARDAANQRYKIFQEALPPTLQHPPRRDAPEWPQGRDAVKKYLEETRYIDPGPVLDSIQDAAKLPDDGTKLPPSSSGPPPDPEHYNAPSASGPKGAPASQDDD